MDGSIESDSMWRRLAASVLAGTALAPGWQQLSMCADPRVADSRGVDMCTHANWVYAVGASVDYTARQQAPPHMRLCAPNTHVRALSQLRTGNARLEVQRGRHQGVCRAQRLCRLCACPDSAAVLRSTMVMRLCEVPGGAGSIVEDLRHFLLECPAYDFIRVKYGLLPARAWAAPDAGACMRALFMHSNQAGVACMVAEMRRHRARMLGEPVTW